MEEGVDYKKLHSKFLGGMELHLDCTGKYMAMQVKIVHPKSKI